MKLYLFDEKTNEFLGEREARLSPLDKKQGRDVFLIPKHATTIKPPDSIAEHATIWDGKKWEHKKIHIITRKVQKVLNPSQFQKDLEQAFPGTEIQIAGDPASKEERDLIFKGIPATQENQDKLDALIEAHKAVNTDMEKLPPLLLACFKVIIEEMRKVDAHFPSFADFKKKVGQSMGD